MFGRYHNRGMTDHSGYLVLYDEVDGHRAQETGYRPYPVRYAHQYAGVSRRDVQVIYVETWKRAKRILRLKNDNVNYYCFAFLSWSRMPVG